MSALGMKTYLALVLWSALGIFCVWGWASALVWWHDRGRR